MWLLAVCLRRAILQQLACLIYICRCPRRHFRKQKSVDDEEDVEMATTCKKVLPVTAKQGDAAHALAQANGQDADELGTPAEIPPWQMPRLLVECAQRPGVRIHKGTSLVLPEAGGDLIANIVLNVPVFLQMRVEWHLGYSLAVDGVSLRTMFRQLSHVGPCLLIVEDSCNCIFGAFMSEGLRPGNQCYGGHECFLFRYLRNAGAWRTEIFRRAPSEAPEDEKVPEESIRRAGYLEALKQCEAMNGAANLPFAATFCDHKGIVCGIDGPALFIDQDLLRGASFPSGSFASPSLTANNEFVVRNLEVWHWGT